VTAYTDWRDQVEDLALDVAPLVIIDTETTGLDPYGEDRDRIIELAILSATIGDDSPAPVLHQHIYSGKRVHPDAQAKHGVSNAALLKAFKEGHAVRWGAIEGEVVRIMRGRTMVAHRAAFDAGMLYGELRRGARPPAGWRPRALCTSGLGWAAWPMAQTHSLAALCDIVGHRNPHPHSAIHDTEACFRVLQGAVAAAGAPAAHHGRAARRPKPRLRRARAPPRCTMSLRISVSTGALVLLHRACASPGLSPSAYRIRTAGRNLSRWVRVLAQSGLIEPRQPRDGVVPTALGRHIAAHRAQRLPQAPPWASNGIVASVWMLLSAVREQPEQRAEIYSLESWSKCERTARRAMDVAWVNGLVVRSKDGRKVVATLTPQGIEWVDRINATLQAKQVA